MDMKKMLLITAVMIPLMVFAQTGKYAKYIKKFDVLQYLPEQCDSNPSTFWRAVVNNNPVLKDCTMKFVEPKGSAKKALEEISRANSLNAAADASYPKMDVGDMNDELNKMLLGSGVGGTKMTFSVLNRDDWNAFCTPDGHVYIHYGLVKRLDMKDEMLFGVLGHEITHYMLRHQLIHVYKVLKREKLNNVGAAIGMAGTAIGNMAAASGGVSMGTPEQQAQQYHQFWDNAERDTRLYSFKYGRDEEIEADIVAYRFLEWIGIDPVNFINALNRINLDNMTGAGDKESDHPSTEFRIGILRQLEPAKWRR